MEKALTAKSSEHFETERESGLTNFAIVQSAVASVGTHAH